ncbi:MAG: family 78 glycoside hydrolase catalytic domain [Clostridia bacterium]|nr:family 78 glycoside hydrolase catalytic domain [Clostridia bacterium]
MKAQSDKKFRDSTWIALDDSFITVDAEGKIVNPWENREGWDRYSEIDTGDGLPVFRKKFGSSTKKPVKCTVHATALGNFELYVNGARVGRKSGSSVKYDELKPGWTDFSKRVLYYSYNLTPYLSENGINCIAAAVSGGWYQGRIACNTYGKHKVAFNAVLELTYADGTAETITTGTDWDSSIAGPILAAEIWDGEVYDATRGTLESLSLPGRRLTGWKKAVRFDDFTGVISKNVGPAIRVRRITMKPVLLTKYSAVEQLEGNDFGRIIVDETVKKPRAVTLKKGETFVYDMGQNMVGWINFTVSGRKGTRLTARYAEMLNDSGLKSRGNDGPEGSIYTANYRSAKARGTYILAGGAPESYHPTFTFYGFRYIELTADGDVEILSLKADVVGSETPETGFLETSSKDINKLISNILWGQRGNYLSIPTDCPQRDERLGWTGDTQIFCGTAAFNAEVLGFFRKWLRDAADSQSEAGAYSDVIPRMRIVGEGNAAWGDAPIIVAYTMYRMYGDVKIVRDTYPSLEKYMKYLSASKLNGPNPGYGDWLAYEPTDGRLISICYYAYDALLMEKLSAVLGKTRKAASYRKLYEKIRRHFQRTYMKRGKLTQTSQTAYILALRFGMLPDAYVETAKQDLARKIKDNGYRLSTGFVGTGLLNTSLSMLGLDNLAYSLLLQTDNPSWLYSVYQGATTIWERWNSYTLDKGFGNVGMNSFNHYAYGSVEEWMYKYMLGIDCDDADPGFRHIILRPTPDNRTQEEMPEGQTHITWVRGSYKSAAGMIAASWSMEDDSFTYNVSVPEGAYATLYLPVFDEAARTVTINGTVSPITDFAQCCGRTVIDLAPGRYTFEVMR